MLCPSGGTKVMHRTGVRAQRALAPRTMPSAIPRLVHLPTRLTLTLQHVSTRVALWVGRCCAGARRARTRPPRAPEGPRMLCMDRRTHRAPWASTWAGADIARRGALQLLPLLLAHRGGKARERRQRGGGEGRGGRNFTGLATLGHGPAARSERASAAAFLWPRTPPCDTQKVHGGSGTDLVSRLCRARCSARW